MIVGLGTGSTAAHFLHALTARMQSEKLAFRGVSSSLACTLLAREMGIPLLGVGEISRVDLYVDGADEVAPDKGLIKGRGAAMVGEKLLAEACDKFLVIADGSKCVDTLGKKFPVPVEVMPGAVFIIERRILDLGGKPTLRTGAGKDGPVVTDNGNLILDAAFPAGSDWSALDQALNALPGVVGHGLFLKYAHKSTVLIGANGTLRTF